MVARTGHDARDLPQVEVRLGDACALELPTASYDVVASSLVLFFLPEPGAALRSRARLLVPGGRLGASTFERQDERWGAPRGRQSRSSSAEPSGSRWSSSPGSSRTVRSGCPSASRSGTRWVAAPDPPDRARRSRLGPAHWTVRLSKRLRGGQPDRRQRTLGRPLTDVDKQDESSHPDPPDLPNVTARRNL